MDLLRIYGFKLSAVFLIIPILLVFSIFSAALPDKKMVTQSQTQSSSFPVTAQINSNSVLVALLDSRYTELAELIEKALLLHTLEHAVGSHNLTIFAPQNDALDSDFKRFLLEPANLHSLQTLLLFHVLPRRLSSNQCFSSSAKFLRSKTLSVSEELVLDPSTIVRPDDINRPDGVIHGIDRFLIPRSVQDRFTRRRSLRSFAAVKPMGAPVYDLRKSKLAPPPAPVKSVESSLSSDLTIFQALAPGPSLAPAPAPGPSASTHLIHGDRHVRDFIETLLKYGGYTEIADILVNLTSLASDIGKLVSEGNPMTLLAPHDEAMGKLTMEQLAESDAAEHIVQYHLIAEYQTEESMYNAVRRFGKVKYQTLRVPEVIVASEADGSVKLGDGDYAAYLFDADIFADGMISVQGIDRVLFPEHEEKVEKKPKYYPSPKKVVKPRRGLLMEMACRVVGAAFSGCQ